MGEKRSWQLVLTFVAATFVVAVIAAFLLRQSNKETAARLAALEANAQPKPEGKAYTTAELGEIYKNNFAAESRDSVWADAAEREYRPILEAELPKTSRLVSFECRSRTCRLEVVHDSIPVSNDFLMHLFSAQYGASLGKLTSGFRSISLGATPDGKAAYAVFLGRPGADDAFPLPHAASQATSR